jgi:hypothetical protein
MMVIIFSMNVGILLFIGLLPGLLHGRVIHVQAGVDPEGVQEGVDWDTSTYFHRALQLSGPGDQIWLKAGLYSPLEGHDPFNGPPPYFVIPPEVGFLVGPLAMRRSFQREVSVRMTGRYLREISMVMMRWIRTPESL